MNKLFLIYLNNVLAYLCVIVINFYADAVIFVIL